MLTKTEIKLFLNRTKLRTYTKTELFEIELFWHLTELFLHQTGCKQKLYLY